MSIRCYATKNPKERLEPFQYDPKPLERHEVEVKISHCGICHSDIHLIDSDWGITDYLKPPWTDGLNATETTLEYKLEEISQFAETYQVGATRED